MRHLRPGGACYPAAGHDRGRDRPSSRDHRRGPRVDQLADPFNLQRFVDAQSDVYDDVLAELSLGRKTSHWMWFVFPRIAGLGISEMNRRYAIQSIEEARAYLAHPLLGPRLRECAALVLACQAERPEDIFPPPDDRKLRSSLALFHRADPEEALFLHVIGRFFAAKRTAAPTPSCP